MLEIRQSINKYLRSVKDAVISKCLDITHIERTKLKFQEYDGQLIVMKSRLRANKNGRVGLSSVPKLDCSISDIFKDELYNPNFQFTFVSPSQPGQASTLQPPDTLFSSTLQTANDQHMTGNTLHKPDNAGANRGTYTCTYHGCTQRFGTPALLQKHKREGHGQALGLNDHTLRRPEGPAASHSDIQTAINKCERVNPSTGKPCHTIFSRPYDLTRHEDIIHNGRKPMWRCNVCLEDKPFSRENALTRHFRVCHPDLPRPRRADRQNSYSHC